MSINTLFNFYIYMYKYTKKMKYNLTKEQKEFIKENYPKFGSEYCKQVLNIEKKSIMSVVAKYHLTRDKKVKINIDLENKYFCYVLGIIWADGSICKKTNKVTISLVEQDMRDIKYIFDKVGNWNSTHHNNSERGYKDQLSLNVSDKPFKYFLTINDFIEKSIISPDKIINSMPTNNVKYFIRGVVDGDGCFYQNKKNYTRQFAITSTYEQDWTYIVNILNSLECKYKIDRVLNKKSKYSSIRINNRDIIKFGRYIYGDFFGLTRKYNKFLEIESSYTDNPYEDRKFRSKKISIEGIAFNSISEAAKFYKMNRNSLRKKLLNGIMYSNYTSVEMSY